jgi:hypothetical protein
MKKIRIVAMLPILLLMFCGAPEEGPKAEEPAKKPEADVYYSSLSENELQRFIKAMPTFKQAAIELNKELESLEGPDAFKAMMGQYSTLHKQMPELDAKLRAAGMPWEEFWPALGKTYMAVGAVFMDSMMGQIKEQMKGQPEEMMKETMQNMEAANEAYKAVPQGNKDLIKKYMKELEEVLGME